MKKDKLQRNELTSKQKEAAKFVDRLLEPVQKIILEIKEYMKKNGIPEDGLTLEMAKSDPELNRMYTEISDYMNAKCIETPFHLLEDPEAQLNYLLNKTGLDLEGIENINTMIDGLTPEGKQILYNASVYMSKHHLKNPSQRTMKRKHPELYKMLLEVTHIYLENNEKPRETPNDH